MGRKRKELDRGQSTNLYVPLDCSEDTLNWINEQMYLNKSIFALIDKEVNKKYENKNIEEIVQREIAKALKDIQIPKERKRENNENTKIDENIQSNLQKKVLSQLDL